MLSLEFQGETLYCSAYDALRAGNKHREEVQGTL